jgi:AcrR family transcriptional regulator
MAQTGKRIARKDRERAILDVAVQYFAEVGFHGQMRELARRIGVSPALLFKYFSTKEALVERVCEEIYLRRWKPEWEAMLDDADFTLRERLTRFYQDYVQTALGSEWIRIFMYGSLAGNDFNRYYLSMVGERIIPRIAQGVRREASFNAGTPFSKAELSLAWGLHGSILYYLIERNIYGTTRDEPDEVVRNRVAGFLDGAAASLESFGSMAPEPGMAEDGDDEAIDAREGGIFAILRGRDD